jgi:shikimate dehydrogenase
MRITKDTKLCISIAERPGNFGATVLSAGFAALGLDFIYKPLQVGGDKLADAVTGIRSLGIRGCGVSMPHKIKVLEYLDEIDGSARKIGAVNTIVNDGGVLCGYNTDFLGAKAALQKHYDIKNKKVFIIGAGGAARAIIVAFQECGAKEIHLTNRDEERGRRLAEEFNLSYLQYAKKNEMRGDLLVNATPVGMSFGVGGAIIDEDAIKSYKAVMDVVVSAEPTILIKTAREFGVVGISGLDMALYQAAEQFRLYTGKEAPLTAMLDSMKDLYKN